MGKSLKGGGFERDLCHRLTLWWTDDPDADVVFWRTSQSGGRATTRRKAGKKGSTHCGDIASTDPSSKPFTDLMMVEAKRGYSQYTLFDLLDKPPHAAQQEVEKWVQQACWAATHAGSFSWIIAFRRDKREAFVLMPHRLMIELRKEGCFPDPVWPFVTVAWRWRFFQKLDKKGRPKWKNRRMILAGTTLEVFLSQVHPDAVRRAAKRLAESPVKGW